MKKILVVDDDVEFCDEMGSLLKDLKYSVEVAYDGWKGIAIAKKGVDLMLFDLKLQNLSGHYFINMIKTDENLKKIPVFVISAMTDDDNVRNAYMCGADEYFTKPISIDELLMKIEDYLLYTR